MSATASFVGGLAPPSPPAADVATALAASAARHPERPALRDADGAYSFAQLTAAAGAVAAAVVQAGAAPGAPVTLLGPNCATLVVGCVGVFGAGCAVVSLDPSHPDERLLRMMVVCKPALLLHRREDAARAVALAAPLALRTLCIEDAMHGPPGVYPARRPRADDLALITFTSGTTGDPKGIEEQFRDAVQRYAVYAQMLGMQAQDRMGVAHFYGGCRIEVYSALLSGACVCLHDLNARGLAGFADWLHSEQITVMRLFPTTFRAFADALGTRHVDTLRALVLLGEPVRTEDVARFRRHFDGDAVLLNVYGSNEASAVTAYPVRSDTALSADGVLPVGWPLPGRRIAVVDEDGSPLPPGEPGRLVIESPDMVRAYHGQPALSAAVLSDTGDGWRRFSSEDRGRLRADGCLEHLGRGDSMVKLRGHRMELDEIEGAIDACRGVQQSAVSVRARRQGGERLVAHVLRRPGARLGVRELRRALARSLPAPMVPAVIVLLDEAPLTVNGKLARAALPDPPSPQPPPADQAPRDTLEALIAQMWCEILDRPAVGRDEDFFEAGGDSLQGAVLLAELEAATGVALPLATLASDATVASLAARLAVSQCDAVEPSLVSLHEHGTGSALFGVCGARGHALRLLILGRALPAQHPVHGLQPPGMSWDAPPRHDIEAMAAFYVQEVRARQPHGPYHLFGSSFGGVVAFEMALQLEAAGEAVAWVMMLDSATPGSTRAARRIAGDHGGGDTRVLAERHRAAFLAYRPAARLRAPLHFGLCIESLVRAADDRDWRALVAGPLRLHLLPGLHGAFHRAPQLPVVARLLGGLLAGRAPAGHDADGLLDGFTLHGKTLCATAGHDLPVLALALERGVVRPLPRGTGAGLRLEGFCVGPDDAAEAPHRLLLFDGERYLGWGAITRPWRERADLPLRRGAFRIDLRDQLTGVPALRAVALDDGRRVAMELPVLDAETLRGP